MAAPVDTKTSTTPLSAPDLSVLQLARAVQLEWVRGLVHLLGKHGPLTYTQLHQAAEKEKVVVTQAGAFPKKSTYYHVVKAAVLQGMLVAGKDGYTLTAAGMELAQLGGSSSELSRSEKAAFRKAFLASDALRPFFALFMGDLQGDVRVGGQAILIRPLPVTHLNNRRQKPYEITSPVYGRIELSHVLTQAIVWGVRLWCLEAGLLDELLVAERSRISADEVQILFPVMEPDAPQCAPDVVAARVPKYFWPIARQGSNFWKASIPELLYRMCPAQGVSVESVKAGLSYWISTHPRSVYAEVVSPSVSGASWVRGHLEDTRFLAKLRKSYLHTSNGYCSHIVVLSDAIRRGEIVRG